MKKVFITIISMLLPIMASADAVEIKGIYYNLISKAKTAEVTSNPNKYKGDVTIPEKITYEGVEYSVESIGDNAFNACMDLTYVSIPNSVTSLGNNAFRWCSGLNSVIIPNKVTSIGEYAFQGTGLTSVSIPRSVTTIRYAAFSGCNKLTSIDIPNGISYLPSGLFQNCVSLTSVTFPNSITEISNSIFKGCSGITTVTIPNSITDIQEYAFQNCSSLKTITIPNSVTDIRCSAFNGCSSLTEITIGNGVKSIELNAFAQCSELTDVYCMVEELSTTNNYGKGPLYTNASAFNGSLIEYVTLHVPESAINTYKTIAPWSGFKEIVPISGGQMTKCATPTISYENGKIKFNCETEGVEFVSELSTADVGNRYSDEVNLTGKTTVKVFATKTGYVNSDVATKVITLSGGNNEQSGVKGDLNNDGEVNVADHVELTKIIMATGANPNHGNDPANPSGDDLETDMITASFMGGATMEVNGRLQNGSQLMVKLLNNSSKSITVTKMQLVDSETEVEGENLLSEQVEVAAGWSISYTVTVGALGIYQPIIRFTYMYNNKTYTAESKWNSSN